MFVLFLRSAKVPVAESERHHIILFSSFFSIVHVKEKVHTSSMVIVYLQEIKSRAKKDEESDRE